MDAPTPKSTVSQIFITIAAFVIVIAGMKAAVSILVPFLLAAFIAIICTPMLFWLQRKGVPTWISLILVVAGVLLIGLAISSLIGSSVKKFSTDLPSYEASLRQSVRSVLAWLENYGVDTSNLGLENVFDPGAAMKLVAGGLNSLGTVLTNGFLILMTVIFMLLEASGLPHKLRLVLGAAEGSLERFDTFIENVKQYMAIKTILSLVTGVIVTIWLAILGLSYPMLWGLLAFLLNYVPNIGSIIAAVPAVLLAIIQLGFLKAIIVAAGYLAVNVGIGSVIEPRLMGRGLGLSTLVVFLSLLFWGWVLGPVGMLLSVPLTITAKIALDSRDETRWIAILLGPEIGAQKNGREAKAAGGIEDG